MNIYRFGFDWDYRTFRPILDKDARLALDPTYGNARPLLKSWVPHGLKPVTETPECLKPLGHFFDTFSRAVVGITSLGIAVPKLREMFLECGELLPVHYGQDTFWLFNCLNTVDALDETWSDITVHENGHRSASHVIFRTNLKIPGSFFCVPESCGATFLTEDFWKFYQDHNLTGLEFTLQDAATPEYIARRRAKDEQMRLKRERDRFRG